MNSTICIDRCFRDGYRYSLCFTWQSGNDSHYASWVGSTNESEDLHFMLGCSLNIPSRLMERFRKMFPVGHWADYACRDFDEIYELLKNCECSKNCPYAVKHALFDANGGRRIV